MNIETKYFAFKTGKSAKKAIAQAESEGKVIHLFPRWLRKLMK